MRHLLLLLTLGVASDSPWTVGLRTFGPIHFGASVAEVSRALGATGKPAAPGLFDGCDFMDFDMAPKGTTFMILDTILVRVDVLDPGVYTRSGIQVGSTEAEVKAAYPGRITVEEHPYEGPQGHYLIYRPQSVADSAFGMIFETDGRIVTRYRSGLRDPVSWIEGCA